MTIRILSSACVVCGGLGLYAAGCAEAEPVDLRPAPPDAASIGDGTGTSTGSGGSAGSGSGSTGSGGAGGKGGGATGGSSGAGGSTGTGGAGKGGSGGGSSGTGGSTGGTGGSGPSGQIFFDDFEDGNSTTPSWIAGDPTLGAVWSVVTREGTNHVFAQSAMIADWVIAVSGDYRWTDQTVEATVKRTSATGMVGIFGRILDMRNYYFLYFDDANIIIRKRVDNSSANLVKVKFTAVTGTAYRLKLSIVGNTLTGYIDGTMMVTASDSFLTTGGIGVGTSDSATGEFDNVAVSR